MKHLFKDWDTLQSRIRQARNLLLFLDYDGTLTPIVSRPEKALCPVKVKRLLETLRDLPGVHLAIVSGRSLEDSTKREVQKGLGRVVLNLQKVPLQVFFQCPHRVCCSDFFTTMRYRKP